MFVLIERKNVLYFILIPFNSNIFLFISRVIFPSSGFSLRLDPQASSTRDLGFFYLFLGVAIILLTNRSKVLFIKKEQIISFHQSGYFDREINQWRENFSLSR
jgi:hypothetical protein